MTAAKIAQLWKTLSGYPGGAWLFNRLIGMYVPYSGSIGAKVQELRPGCCRVLMKDRRKVRNHLRCVHAVALVNLGEIASGLAMYATIPVNIRGIVVSIEIEYFKKARGDLLAESQCELPQITEAIDYPLYTSIKDSEGEEVARVKVTWRLEAKV